MDSHIAAFPNFVKVQTGESSRIPDPPFFPWFLGFPDTLTTGHRVMASSELRGAGVLVAGAAGYAPPGDGATNLRIEMAQTARRKKSEPQVCRISGKKPLG